MEKVPNAKPIQRIRAFFGNRPHLAFAIIALLSAFVIELFACVCTSPLYPAQYAYNDVTIDPNFFLYAGKLLNEGKTPYIDFFDHKGLYVFAMNAFGMSLGMGKAGVFIIQVLFYSISLHLFYEAIREFGWGYRGIITGTCLFFLGSVACYGGNHTGEWLLPFSSLILFFAAKAIRSGEEKWWFWAVFAGGLQAGMSFNSRPSDAMWGLAVCVAYFIHYLHAKSAPRLNILWAILIALGGFFGPFMVTIPMSIAGGYTKEMLDYVILQNLVYVGGHAQGFRWFYHFLVGLWIAVAALMSVYRIRHQKSDFDMHVFLLCNLVIGGGVNLLIARYTHYYISAFPFACVEIISFFECLKGKKVDFSTKAPRHVFDGLIATSGAFLGVLILSMSYTVGWMDTSVSQEAQIEAAIKTTIPQFDLERLDGVYCLDTNVSTYLNNNIRVSCRFYTFQTWWAIDNKQVNDAVIAYLQEKKPTWIIRGEIGANELEYEEKELGYQVVQYVESHYAIPSSFDRNTPRITIWKLI